MLTFCTRNTFLARFYSRYLIAILRGGIKDVRTKAKYIPAVLIFLLVDVQ
jgi:hypothetical protein